MLLASIEEGRANEQRERDGLATGWWWALVVMETIEASHVRMDGRDEGGGGGHDGHDDGRDPPNMMTISGDSTDKCAIPFQLQR